jgi:hypothetical protein
MATAQEIAAAQAMIKMAGTPPGIRAPQGPIYWQAPGSGAAAPRAKGRRKTRKSRRANRKSRRANRR